jgi:hypothetical protein
MLDHAEISIGTLLVWIGVGLGVAMVIVGDLTHHELIAHLGLMINVITCAHGVRRAIVARDEAIHCAFELGVDKGRLESVPLR